jgi:zinc D-Ala-D-Ala dipeptidase
VLSLFLHRDTIDQVCVDPFDLTLFHSPIEDELFMMISRTFFSIRKVVAPSILAFLMLFIVVNAHSETGAERRSLELSNQNAGYGMDRGLSLPGNRMRDLDTVEPAARERNMCELEKKFRNAGLMNVKDIDESLVVELKYASSNNFMGTNVYGDMNQCYLQRDAALKLKKANDILKKHDPRLRILVADGCRPRSVQRKMWEIVKGTPNQKYIANPAAASMHNFGAAVDVTIVDEKGDRLDMGVPMDHFGVLSHPCEEARLLREGKLTQKQVSNRRLLRDVMVKAGFQPLSIEWWHFNAVDRKIAMQKYRIIE